MKKFLSVILSVSIAIGAFTFVDKKISGTYDPVDVYAAETDAKISGYGGWHESFFVVWENDKDAENAKVYYKKSDDTEYTQLDEELVRASNGGGRADIVGIAAGKYDVKIALANGSELIQNDINTDNFDRSGYAHFNNTEGVGAYNDDGTPKANADIIYVTNENKNDVEYNGKKGIANILGSKISNPLIVRFIGTVDTQTRDADGTKTTDIKNGVIAINGLKDQASSDDSYFNMCDIDSAKNITLEGIGTDAVIEKWGFTFKKSKYIEVRNLRFTKYPEDACSFIGNSSNNCENIWLHNCTFDVGENKYDLTSEQDKHEGDGSTDVAYAKNVTLSYNRFNNCHKTSLNGNSDGVKQYNITWHHNYFYKSGSRMPLVRQANVHSYNNYFYKTTNACIDARASAWVFSEANYFEECANSHKTTPNKSYGDPIIKSFNDVKVKSTSTDDAGTLHIASTRSETYAAGSNKNPYPNFDTNADMFYYKNGVSDVEKLESAESAKQTCIKESGVMTENSNIPPVQTTETTTAAETSTETTTATTIVTTTETTTQAINVTTTEISTETTTEDNSTDKTMLGDVNLDKEIKADDAALALQYTLNKAAVNIPEQGIKNADVNKDGQIDSNDSAKILQKSLLSTFEF